MSHEPTPAPRDTQGRGDDSSSTPTEIWTEPDRALHQLLDAVFKDGQTEWSSSNPGAARRWTDISHFLDGSEAPFPGSVIGAELTPGQRLGRFRIERELGRGGFGLVYLAFDNRLGRRVALKVPRPDRVQNAALWGRFAREARLIATLDHEAIVPVLDAGVIEGIFFIATAYQDGEPLSCWLARRPGGLDPRAAAALAERLAAGLAHAHSRGVLHRDLKPDNVLMVPPDPEVNGVVEGPASPPATPAPKITDYGLGTFRGPPEPGSLTGIWQGSPPYMAPEQVLPAAGAVDARADVYALGAILYEMLTGRTIYPCRSLAELSVRLHRGDPPIAPRQLRRKIPRDLETICLKCLERNPAERYASAEALQQDLQLYLADRPIHSRPLSRWGRAARWARRHPSHAALAGVSMLSLVVLLGLSIRHQMQLEEKNVLLTSSHQQLDQTNRELRTALDDIQLREGELHASYKRLDQTNRELRAALDDIRRREDDQKRQRYADEIMSASSYLAGGGREAAQLVLRWQIPRLGDEDDLREFAWNHLWAEATRDYILLSLTEPSSIVPDPVRWAERISRGQERSPRLSQSAEWVRIDPSGLSVHDWAGSYFLTRGGPVAQVDLDEKRVWYDDEAGRHLLEEVSGRPLLTPDGRTLVLSVPGRFADRGGAPQPVLEKRLVRIDSGSTLEVVQVPEALERVISADGGTLACLARLDPASETCRLMVYDLKTGHGIAVPKVERELWIEHAVGGVSHRYLSSLAISPDGQRVALNDRRTPIQVIDLRGGRTLWEADAEHFGPASLVTALSFSPDGRYVVSGDSEGKVRLWDAESGNPWATAPFAVHPIAAVGFYPDAVTVAAVAHGEDTIRLWPIVPKPEPPPEKKHGDEVWALVFLPGGKQLISAGDDNHIWLWDVGRAAPAEVIGIYDTLVTALALSPDGKTLVSADYHGHVRLHDLNRIDAAARPIAKLPDKVRALAWSPDSRHLAIGGNAPVILVWERDTDRVLEITDPPGETYGLAWSPDGSSLAAASHQRKLSLWSWPDRARIKIFESRHPLTSVAFATDGESLVVGDAAGGLHSWVRMGSGFSLATSRQASGVGGVWGLEFSPDGRTLATASDDGSIRLWDPSGLRELCRLARRARKAHALAFSRDGRQLASGDFDGLITIHQAGSPGGD